TARLRFVASDYPGGSLVEAGVDDVRLLLTGVVGAPETNAGPSVFSLLQCRPNPCGAAGTSIGFSLASPGIARLDLYDIQGRAVRRLLDGPRPAGLQSVLWDGRDESGAAAPSGIYLYRLRAGGRNEVRKLIRIE
ncbi:MAG: T9SS type A sorting domain-containing protein, partial [Candidatus Eisenbacteria bacterium]|nr:T9SS type A sorting domain-containing protein [Candidatus Eisenbacteria bacterium]